MDEAGRNAKANGSEFLKAFEELKNQNVSGNRSNMYQVNIPDKHAARMLDWDKPLSEQAGLKNLLESAGITMTDSKLKTGATAYGMLADRLGSKEAATAALKDAGIPGIKYLDQGSRNRGPWTLITGTGSKLEYGTEEAAKTALQAGLTRGEKLKLIEPAAQTRNFVVFDPAILEDVTRK
jgi:hypothetical protein